jgi:hypothetical protein
MLRDADVNDNDLIAQLLTRVEELEGERDEARADKNERERVLRDALEEIARQELIDEMSDEGDIEGGYDACVKRARAALGEKP